MKEIEKQQILCDELDRLNIDLAGLSKTFYQNIKNISYDQQSLTIGYILLYMDHTILLYMDHTILLYMDHTILLYMDHTILLYMYHTILLYMDHTILLYMDHTILKVHKV